MVSADTPGTRTLETLGKEDAMECEHGTDVGSPSGRDRLCTLCETDFPTRVEPGDVWVVAGHTHALEKRDELARETGLPFTVRVKDQDEYQRVGASKAHYEVLAVEPIVGTPQRYVVIDTGSGIVQSDPMDFDSAVREMLAMGDSTYFPDEDGRIPLGITEETDTELDEGTGYFMGMTGPDAHPQWDYETIRGSNPDEDEDPDEDLDQDPEPIFRLTIHQDQGPTDEPDSGIGMYKVRSFNSRHTAFEDPETVFACVECGAPRDEYSHTDVPQKDDGDWKHETWAREYRENHPDELHEYQMREGFVLSYFEHGNCRWGLAGSMSGMPDFRWDGVGVAGFLEIDPTAGGIDGDRTWYDSKTEDQKTEMAEAFLEEYTAWCNGEVYGYTLERIQPKVCDLGFTHEETLEDDSCWGFIGFDWFQEAVRDATYAMGATEETTEIVDDCYGMADYGRYFHTEDELAAIRERTAG